MAIYNPRVTVRKLFERKGPYVLESAYTIPAEICKCVLKLGDISLNSDDSIDTQNKNAHDGAKPHIDKLVDDHGWRLVETYKTYDNGKEWKRGGVGQVFEVDNDSTGEAFYIGVSQLNEPEDKTNLAQQTS